MPGELTQAEFYHYYTASQRRVELWVQETNKTLSIQARAQGQATQFLENDIISFLPSPQQTQTQLPLPIQHQHQPLPTPSHSQLKEQESPTSQDAAAGKPPPRRSSRSKGHEITRTSSRDRAPHSPSHSRSRPSSGSKKIAARGHHKLTTKASRSASPPPRPRHSSEDTSSGLAAYIPYGVLPLLFAVTQAGASTLYIVAGVILLSGFVYVDQLHENPVSWLELFLRL